MVIDLQGSHPPKISCNYGNGNKVYPNTNGIFNSNGHQEAEYIKDQLAIIRTNLLNPNEVKFSNVSDGGIGSRDHLQRKRLTTISSATSETDSIASTITVRPVSSVHPTKKNIPDGGYGWVIVFASLMTSLIADGISFSFGLLYTELLGYFHEGPAKTAWVGSLFFAVPLLVGPIMSNLVDKYGCRKMTICGGLISCAGFVMSSYSNSIELLYLTTGIISGLGLGLIYVTAVVSIAFWFDKKRTFATGIGASGTGLGTFLYAPLTQWLVSSYGWRGAMLILAGSLLNLCVMGALMRDPDWLIEENKLESRSQSMQTFSNSSVCLDEIKKMLTTGAPKEDVLDTLVTNYNTEANQQIRDIGCVKKYQSELLLPTFVSNPDSDALMDGIRSSSRRSLRPDKVKSPDTPISHDDFISPHLLSHTDTKNEINNGEDDNEETTLVNDDKRCKIASTETLNTSEKASTNYDCDMVSLNLSIDQHTQNVAEYDEGFVTSKRSGMHGSRLSLNDILMNKTRHDSIKEDLRRNFRGNSLNIVYENEPFQPIEQSSPLKKTIENNEKDNSNEMLQIEENNFIRYRYTNQKFADTMPNCGALKRNPSLRYSNYLKNMRIHRNSIHYRGAMLNTHRYRLKASSCPNIYRNSMTTIAKEDEKWYDDFLDIVKSVFDFSLFMEYKFGMMSLSTLFLFTWYSIPYLYITEHLLKFDYTEEDSAYLISIIGIFNTIGMIFLGWIGDQPWLNVIKTYAVCLFLCGVSIFLIPIATYSYALLVILCVLFGITFASSFSFTPILTCRLVDLDDFTLAYGLILLVQGIGSLIGPPLAGFIYDLTGRWDDAFYAGGIFISISGFLAYIIGSDHVDVDEEVNNNDDEEIGTKKKIVH